MMNAGMKNMPIAVRAETKNNIQSQRELWYRFGPWRLDSIDGLIRSEMSMHGRF
jgi:hypothetical protein